MLKLHPKNTLFQIVQFFIWQYQSVEEMQPFFNRCPQINWCYIIKRGKGCTSLGNMTKRIDEHRQFSKWEKKKKYVDFFSK